MSVSLAKKSDPTIDEYNNAEWAACRTLRAHLSRWHGWDAFDGIRTLAELENAHDTEHPECVRRVFRANYPGPSMEIIADNLDAATCQAATYLPALRRGHYLVQKDVFSPRFGLVRRVHIVSDRAAAPITGFAISQAQ